MPKYKVRVERMLISLINIQAGDKDEAKDIADQLTSDWNGYPTECQSYATTIVQELDEDAEADNYVDE